MSEPEFDSNGLYSQPLNGLPPSDGLAIAPTAGQDEQSQQRGAFRSWRLLARKTIIDPLSSPPVRIEESQYGVVVSQIGS